jgi:hypothetical protein
VLRHQLDQKGNHRLIEIDDGEIKQLGAWVSYKVVARLNKACALHPYL